MAFDLGDPIPLVFLTTDPSGAPAAVTTAALTITLPDGSALTPAVATVSTGMYAPTVPFIASQLGHYKVSWVGSGVNAQNYDDVFNVLGADPRFLISLADARSVLRLPASNTTADEELRWYLAALTTVVEDMTGPVLAATGRTWTVDGGACQVLLPSAVASVESVIDTGVTLAPSDYTVNVRAGIVTRGSLLYPFRFLPGIGNVTVTYTVGASTVPANILLGAKIILQQMWQADHQGYRPAFGSADTSTVQTPTGFLIPKRAYELLKSSPNVPGFA